MRAREGGLGLGSGPPSTHQPWLRSWPDCCAHLSDGGTSKRGQVSCWEVPILGGWREDYLGGQERKKAGGRAGAWTSCHLAHQPLAWATTLGHRASAGGLGAVLSYRQDTEHRGLRTCPGLHGRARTTRVKCGFWGHSTPATVLDPPNLCRRAHPEHFVPWYQLANRGTGRSCFFANSKKKGSPQPTLVISHQMLR